MEILILMAQRKESYECEYAPEALAVITEYGDDDNPEYMLDEISAARSGDEFTAVEVVRIKVDDDALNAALFPRRTPICADVVSHAG